MKTFNSRIKAEQTKVQLSGEYGYRLVKSVHDTKKWITVHGLEGSLQKSDVIAFTNTTHVDMYPTAQDTHTSDQYGSVFVRGQNENIFVGKLNGLTLNQFVSSL